MLGTCWDFVGAILGKVGNMSENVRKMMGNAVGDVGKVLEYVGKKLGHVKTCWGLLTTVGEKLEMLTDLTKP